MNIHACVQVNIPPLLSAKGQYKIMKKQNWKFTQHLARLVRFNILLCLNIGYCAQTTSVVVRLTKLKIIAWVWSRSTRKLHLVLMTWCHNCPKCSVSQGLHYNLPAIIMQQIKYGQCCVTLLRNIPVHCWDLFYTGDKARGEDTLALSAFQSLKNGVYDWNSLTFSFAKIMLWILLSITSSELLFDKNTLKCLLKKKENTSTWFSTIEYIIVTQGSKKCRLVDRDR